MCDVALSKLIWSTRKVLKKNMNLTVTFIVPKVVHSVCINLTATLCLTSIAGTSNEWQGPKHARIPVPCNSTLNYNWKETIRYSDMRLSSTYFNVGLPEILCQDIPSIIIF